MDKANANAQKLFEPAEKGTIPTLKQIKGKTKKYPRPANRHHIQAQQCLSS